ncbi:hypothetical protein ES703_119696 [subsurface metagenome]
MKLIIIVKTKEDLPEEVPYDCQAAVEDTLKEHEIEIEDINFHIES